MNTITKSFIAGIVILASSGGLFSIAVQTANAANCTPNASKQCISNIVYWYDSCGAVQSVAQNCNTTGQVCQNAQCVNSSVTTQTGTNHFTKSCYQGNLYWYSSQGTLQEMVQNCQDTNSCTADNCTSSTCLNQLKCDGSTCAVGSPDYTTYCQAGQTGNTNTTTTTTTTGTNTQNLIPNTQTAGLAISLFVAKEAKNPVWQKTLNIASNDKLMFLEVIKNTSTSAIDNVSIATDITGNLAYTGNLQIDGITSAGNLAAGIPLGTIPAKTSKMIIFTATSSATFTQAIFQATGNISTNSIIQDSDYAVLNSATATAAGTLASTTTATSTGLWAGIMRNWWIWLIILIILVVVFIIIFRKLSSNV